eukprot:Sspe_Gene.37090::Locus_17904_Transcript_1_1_Confidence_1.000_Length_2132::g.37090::m.37090/K03514/PAPD5_7, TRF4; non-canonical poly(A) RNA polymerase PAPD5/7
MGPADLSTVSLDTQLQSVRKETEFSSLNPRAASFVPKGGNAPVGGAALPQNKSLNPDAKPFRLRGVKGTPQSSASSRDGTPPERALKRGDSKLSVSTPWYPDGIEKGSLQLKHEITAFAQLMQLTDEESEERDQLCTTIQHAVQTYWPESDVFLYGSYRAGTSAPTSAIDLFVDGCHELDANTLTECFARVGSVCSMLCEGDTAFVQVEGSKAVANVSLHAAVGSTSARESVEVMRKWCVQHPVALPVHCVMRQVLEQTGNLDVASGGLSAYALFAAIVASCLAEPTSDPARALLSFCSFFSQADFEIFSIDPILGLVPRVHQEDMLSIIDPVDTSNNLAAGCTKLFQIRTQVQHCWSALMRWSGDAHSDQWKGYKGRTPLSGIISHQQLWGRARALRHTHNDTVPREVKGRPLPLSPSAHPFTPSPVLRSTESPVSAFAGCYGNSSNDSIATVDDSGDALLRDIDAAVANDLLS